MKVHSIHLLQAGPISERTIDLTNSWTDAVHERVLLTGPNGTGKSTVLRAVACLWEMVGQWLAAPDVKPKNRSEARTWLRAYTKAVGLVVSGVPGVEGRIGLYFGTSDYLTTLEPKAEYWMGEVDATPVGKGRPRLVHYESREWMRTWSQCYRVLRLGTEPSETNGCRTPNVIYLEAEDRRWVRPKGDPTQPVPDDPSKRWLVTYEPEENWQGQVEASLIALKILDEPRYREVVADLNRFLVGKSIRTQPTEKLRLRVDLAASTSASSSHSLDDLSAGERQVLMQLYLISRWLQPGGLVLMDEPDLHLHPSLIRLFLARVEAIVAERKGQLIITSHLPEIWRNYETRALRERLGGEL